MQRVGMAIALLTLPLGGLHPHSANLSAQVGDHFGKRWTVDQLHRKEMMPRFVAYQVHRHDVPMTQFADRSNFIAKPSQLLLVQRGSVV